MKIALIAEAFAPCRPFIFKGMREHKFIDPRSRTERTNYTPIYEQEPNGVLMASHDVFCVRLYPSGRLTLDVGYRDYGELLDAKVKGRTKAERLQRAVDILHECIEKSGLEP